MSMFTDFRSFVVRQRAIRARIRTAMFLASLPGDLRKDIGWPDGERFSSQDRRSAGSATQTP